MDYSKRSKIKNLDDELSFLECELAIFSENIAYFESTQTKYDLQIDFFNDIDVKTDDDLRCEANIKNIRNDLSERVSRLYTLRDKKIKRVAEINDELKRLY